MPRTVGILGGMGPEATAEFYRKLIELTSAASDQEHLPVIMLSDPSVPDRTDYILGSGQPFLPILLQLARDLESFGADFIAMPCNTAHLFWPELADAVGIPFLNILEETIDEIESTAGSDSVQIGVLATVGTIRSALYQSALRERGITALIPPESVQHEVHGVIKWVKAQTEREASRDQLEAAVQSLCEDGADGVILGCTELGLVGDLESSIPVFDSLEILARATLREALNLRSRKKGGPGHQ